MDESTRNEIIRMFYSRAPHRRIAKTLGVDRKTVAKIIAEHEEDRTGAPPKERKPRKSLLDPFQDNVVQLLERYPEITAVRMAEELRRLGFKGAYSIVAIICASCAATLGNWFAVLKPDPASSRKWIIPPTTSILLPRENGVSTPSAISSDIPAANTCTLSNVRTSPRRFANISPLLRT